MGTISKKLMEVDVEKGGTEVSVVSVGLLQKVALLGRARILWEVFGEDVGV